jgi:TolB protein
MTYRFRMRTAIGLLTAGLIALCLLWASNAKATFPGTNGEIAFLCENDQTVLNVCAIAPSGGAYRAVSGLAGGFRSAPRWSPDARRILYQYEDPSFGIMGAPGLRWIPRTAGYGQPAWSPRGNQVAIVRAPDTVRPKGIYTTGLDGRGQRRVVTDGAQPDWSPDGRTLAYQTGGEIWLYNLARKTRKRLTHSPRGSSSSFPSWAPDGRRLAFSRKSGTGATKTSSIFIIGANGSRERQVTHNQIHGPVAGDDDPSWSPDGRFIAFVHAPDNATGWFLAVIGVDGSDQRTLVGPPALHAFAPDWGRRRR